MDGGEKALQKEEQGEESAIPDLVHVILPQGLYIPDREAGGVQEGAVPLV